MARKIQPIGLRGRRRASTKPTTPNGTAPSASPPLTCGLCLASRDSGTRASATSANTTPSTSAVVGEAGRKRCTAARSALVMDVRYARSVPGTLPLNAKSSASSRAPTGAEAIILHVTPPRRASQQGTAVAPGVGPSARVKPFAQMPRLRRPQETAHRQPAQQSQPARRLDRPRQTRRHPRPPRRRQPRTGRRHARRLRHHRQTARPALQRVLRLHVLRPDAPLRSRRAHQSRLPPAPNKDGAT